MELPLISILSMLLFGLIGLFFTVLRSSRNSDRNFSDLRADMNQRFNDFGASVDRRFDTVDRRFDDFGTSVDQRFDESRLYMDQRFDAVNGRIDYLRSDMNHRFDTVNVRIDNLRLDMDRRFDELKDSFKEMSGRVNFLVDNLAVRSFRARKIKPHPHPGNQ